MEYSYPIQIHRYGLVPDSGGAGYYRGGCATVWEVEPLEHEMTAISFGEGRLYPALGANGAESACPDLKLGRVERKEGDEISEVMRKNAIMTVQPGQRVATTNPGGGGWGNPQEREIWRVVHDVRNGYISAEAAEREYGVKVDTQTWTGAACGSRLA